MINTVIKMLIRMTNMIEEMSRMSTEEIKSRMIRYMQNEIRKLTKG